MEHIDAIVISWDPLPWFTEVPVWISQCGFSALPTCWFSPTLPRLSCHCFNFWIWAGAILFLMGLPSLCVDFYS